MEYVAIDFETANGSRTSVCSVGMAFYRDGKLIGKEYRLINPEEEFSSMNIKVHGIFPKDVEGEMTFKEYYPRIKSLIDGKLLVAHNAGFDMSVLTRAIEKYGLEQLNVEYVCTLKLSKKMMPFMTSHKLDVVTNFLGIELNHHNALSDALACGEILKKINVACGVKTKENLENIIEMKESEQLLKMQNVKKKKNTKEKRRTIEVKEALKKLEENIAAGFNDLEDRDWKFLTEIKKKQEIEQYEGYRLKILYYLSEFILSGDIEKLKEAPSHVISYAMVYSGISVKKVSETRKIQENTVMNHISKCLFADVKDISTISYTEKEEQEILEKLPKAEFLSALGNDYPTINYILAKNRVKKFEEQEWKKF